MRLLTTLAVLAPLCSAGLHSIALAQQTAPLAIGPVSIKLRRINTFSGSGNANILFGATAPGDSRLFLVQQGVSPSITGKIRYVNPAVVDDLGGTLLDFGLALPTALDATHFEKGLLGTAFHPDFANAGTPGFKKFYTYSTETRAFHAAATGMADGGVDFIHAETATNPESLINNIAVLREWTANSTTPTGVDGPSRIVMKIADPQNQHNGGTIAFSPVDGYLYWALGDGGGNSSNSPDAISPTNPPDLFNPIDGHTNAVGNLPHGNSQDRTNPLGDMLRINPIAASVAADPNAAPSANLQYQIPNDNPFTQASNIDPSTELPYADWDPAWVDEIYAYGLRNPYRFSFDVGSSPSDPARGTLYLADPGYNDREEVDVIVRGGNYGWVIREGTQPMQGTQGIPAYTAPVNPATGLPDGLIDPVAEYHESIGIATIGGFVYRGSESTTLSGKYVFGDFQSPLRGGDGLLMYFDVNESKAPGAPFTIRRLDISALGASLPSADLLGIGQGPAGQIYAMFDNGSVYELMPFYTADFDKDGDVDGADLTRWSSSFGLNAMADADGDGDSDGADFLAWQRQLGSSINAVAGASSVPEPSGAVLLAIGACLSRLGGRGSCRAAPGTRFAARRDPCPPFWA